MSKIYLVKKRTMHETWCLVVDDDANVAGARALENDGVYETYAARAARTTRWACASSTRPRTAATTSACSVDSPKSGSRIAPWRAC